MADVNPQLISYGFSPLPSPREGFSPSIYDMRRADAELAWVVQMPESAVIGKVGIHIVQKTNPPEYTLKLRTFTLNEDPWNWDVVRDATIPQSVDAGFQFFTLTTLGGTSPFPYYPCSGDVLSLTLEHKSGTIGVNNSISVTGLMSGFDSNFAFPQLKYKPSDSVGWTGVASGVPIVALRSATNTYGFTPHTDDVIGDHQGIGDRVGMRFKLPSGFGSKFRVSGVRIKAATLLINGVIEMNIWKDGQAAPLQSVAFANAALPQRVDAYRELFFADPLADLDYGTEYILAFRGVTPGVGGARVSGLVIDANDLDLMDALPGGKEVYGMWYNASAPAQWIHEKQFRPLFDLVLAKYATP